VTLFLTSIHCPVCGEDTEADMLHDGYLVASASEATLRCRSCATEFRVEFFEVGQEEKP